MIQKTLLFMTASLICCPVFAQNKTKSDKVFDEPKKGEGTQVLLGLGELYLAKMAWPDQSEKSNILRSAENDLESAKALITETEKAEKVRNIQSILGTASGDQLTPSQKADLVAFFNANNPDGDELTTAKLLPEDLAQAEDFARAELQRAKAINVVTVAAKAESIEKAGAELTKARQAALAGLDKEAKLAKTIRGVRKVGSSLFILDVASRIYVWNALDANPTLTPVGTFAWKKASALFEKSEAPTEVVDESNENKKGSGH
jgi:hypothetical protein